MEQPVEKLTKVRELSDSSEFIIKPIGLIRTCFPEKNGTPRSLSFIRMIQFRNLDKGFYPNIQKGYSQLRTSVAEQIPPTFSVNKSIIFRYNNGIQHRGY